MYELVKQKLTDYPNFRERSQRGEYLAKLALRHVELEGHHAKGGVLSFKQISDIAIAYASLERAWRKVTEEHKELRGSDYEDKIELVQAKQLELGYAPQNLAFLKKMEQLVDEFNKQ